MTITRLHPDGSDERELRYRLGVEKNRQSGLGAPTPEKPITTPTAIIKKTIEEAQKKNLSVCDYLESLEKISFRYAS